MRKFSARELFAIQVCRFATDNGIAAKDVIQLSRLASRAFSAGEHQANTGDGKRFDKALAAFEKAAAELGFSVQWPGLAPAVSKGDNRDQSIPM